MVKQFHFPLPPQAALSAAASGGVASEGRDDEGVRVPRLLARRQALHTYHSTNQLHSHFRSSGEINANVPNCFLSGFNMGKCCVAYGCSNQFKKGSDIKFHYFPKVCSKKRSTKLAPKRWRHSFTVGPTAMTVPIKRSDQACFRNGLGYALALLVRA